MYVLTCICVCVNLQAVDELDLTKSEGEFLTADSAEELLAPALTPGGKIAKVRRSISLYKAVNLPCAHHVIDPPAQQAYCMAGSLFRAMACSSRHV